MSARKPSEVPLTAADTPQPDSGVVPAPPAAFDPKMLSRVIERRSRTDANAFSGGEVIPRRYATFTLDFSICEPGVFESDFSVTLRSLRSTEEMAALRGTGDEAATIGLGLAKTSLWAVNGSPLTDDQREFMWEALGSGGRQVVCGMYAQCGFAPAEAMGKALRSHTIS